MNLNFAKSAKEVSKFKPTTEAEKRWQATLAARQANARRKQQNRLATLQWVRSRQAAQRNAKATLVRQAAKVRQSPNARQAAQKNAKAVKARQSPKARSLTHSETAEILSYLLKHKKKLGFGYLPNYTAMKKPRFLHISNWRNFEKFLNNSRKKYEEAKSEQTKFRISQQFIKNFKNKASELREKVERAKAEFQSLKKSPNNK
jgi:hypothetical protein